MIALDGVLDRGYRLTRRHSRAVPDADAGARASTGRARRVREARRAAQRVATTSACGTERRVPARRRRSARSRSTARSAFPRRPVEWQVDPNPIDHARQCRAPLGRRRRARPRHRADACRCRAALRRSRSRPATTSRPVWTSRSSRSRPNGGTSWRSLARHPDDDVRRPDASPLARRNLPGLTGRSGGGQLPAWATRQLRPRRLPRAHRAPRFPLRQRRRGSPSRAGGSTTSGSGTCTLTDGSSLAGWQSFSQRQLGEPLVGLHGAARRLHGERDKRAFIHRLRARRPPARPALRRGPADPARAGGYDVVAAIVTYDEPTEGKAALRPVRLRVNGVLQPGG